MKIVMVTTNDPAGTAIQFARAINRYTEHECRLVTTEIRYNFMFDKDLHVPWLDDLGELERVLANADLFHFHMGADEHLSLGGLRVRDFVGNRPIVHHHHGEPAFREDPRLFAERELQLGRRAIVATPDLLHGYPEATWIPNTVPIDEPLYQPLPQRPSDPIWICHSPTRRELKNTVDFIAAMARLRDRHPQAACRLVEHTRHTECLSLKRTSHVAFDHMQGYFGVSALEALSQGLPTIVGLDDWNYRHLQEFTGVAELPFVLAHDPPRLELALEALVAEPEHREAIGHRSRRFMEAHWSPRKIAHQLAEFYEAA